MRQRRGPRLCGSMNSPKGEAMPTFRALFEFIERTFRMREAVRESLADFTPCLIMNRKHRSERDMLRGMVTASSTMGLRRHCSRYTGRG